MIWGAVTAIAGVLVRKRLRLQVIGGGRGILLLRTPEAAEMWERQVCRPAVMCRHVQAHGRRAGIP